MEWNGAINGIRWRDREKRRQFLSRNNFVTNIRYSARDLFFPSRVSPISCSYVNQQSFTTTT
ncbi:hypothetical protein V6N13_034636 [Hibiscus sabdariffa]